MLITHSDLNERNGAIREYNNLEGKEAITKLFNLLSENNNVNNKFVRRNINIFTIRIIFSFFFDSLEHTEDFCITKILKGLLVTESMKVEKSIMYLFDGFKNKDRFIPLGLVKNNLFEDSYEIPNISLEAHKHLITFKDVEWREIDLNVIYNSFLEFNKDDDGYQFRLIDTKEISYLLDGLFLNTYYDKFDVSKSSPNHLNRLRRELASIKIIDPNCGNGVCLVVSYEKLCELEFKIIDQLKLLGKNPSTDTVKTSQLYGIEKNVVSCMLAKLSLTIVDYRMQTKRKSLRNVRRYLTSYNNSHIIRDDGFLLDWSKACNFKGSGTYVISDLYNNSETVQREWMLKNIDYIKDSAIKSAFICKDTISLNKDNFTLWDAVFKNNLYLNFLFKTFKKNNGLEDAVIIGLTAKKSDKVIYTAHEKEKPTFKKVPIISPLLENNPFEPNADISLLPGHYPECLEITAINPGSLLMLSEEEKNTLLQKEPESFNWVRRLIGTEEFNETLNNWCLWCSTIPFNEVDSLKKIRDLIYSIKIQKRKENDDFEPMVNIFSVSNMSQIKKGYSIVIPTKSPKSRKYYPIGLYRSEDIIAKTFVINDANMFLFGLLSSTMFNEWIELNSSKYGENYYFSIKDHYNSFPWPSVTREQISLITMLAENVLMVRESFPNCNIKSLYGITTMPIELLEAHSKLDRAVEKLFNRFGFISSLSKKQYLTFLHNKG